MTDLTAAMETNMIPEMFLLFFDDTSLCFHGVPSRSLEVAGDSFGRYRQIFVESHRSTEKSLQQRMETLLIEKKCS